MLAGIVKMQRNVIVTKQVLLQLSVRYNNYNCNNTGFVTIKYSKGNTLSLHNAYQHTPEIIL